MLARLSEPISVPPGRSTRSTSASTRFWPAAVGMWCSIVNEPAESKEPSPNGSAAASPCMTWTLVPAKRWRSASAAASSISTATSSATRCRSQSAVAPGPGPTSSIRGPSSIPAQRPGSTSWCMWAAHSGLGQTRA